MLRSKEFWIAAANRAVRTGGQVFLASVGTAKIIDEVNWEYLLSATAFAMILSIVNSIVTGLPEVKE